jgi:hypothetical protein
MGDTGDDLKELNRLRKERKDAARRKAVRTLEENEISFESKNFGSHLIVRYNSKIVDFWPGTGAWIPRDNPLYRGKGIHRLLDYLHWNPSTRR